MMKLNNLKILFSYKKISFKTILTLFLNYFNKINNLKKNIGLIHKSYLCFLKNYKNYTANTKTKSEVRGGGKKPWNQKGTGKARAGSIRSPLWVGGGIIFGPKFKILFKKINKKEKKKSLLLALLLKKYQIKFVSESFFFNSFLKTKILFNKLKKISEIYKNKHIMIISNLKFFSIKNLKNFSITNKNSINLKNLLKSSLIIFCI